MEKNNNKQLSLVITFHNKEEFELLRLFKSLEKIDLKKIEIIFVYREASNSILTLVDEWKEKLEIIILKIDEGLKNTKILKSIAVSNARYLQVLDPDDVIDSEMLNNFVEELMQINSDVILNTHIENGNLIEDVLPKNHSLIFKKGIFSNEFVSQIRDNEVSQDVYFCGMVFLETNTFTSVNFPFYNYIVDRENVKHMSSINYLISKIDKAEQEYILNLEQFHNAFEKYEYNNMNEKKWAYDKAVEIFEWRLRQIEKIKEDGGKSE